LASTLPLRDYFDPLRALCEEAGAAILAHYHSAAAEQYESKADDSPLTAADLESHEIIVRGLSEFGFPVLSEESPPEQSLQRREWDIYWLVDPLDGTKEFLGRTGEFTINIALVQDGVARLGMVSVPLEASFYCGGPGEGAWKHAGGAWHPICCRPLADVMVVQTSRRHRGERLERCLQQVREAGFEVEREYHGSALKFCHMAEGNADFYPRFAPCCEWDTAAGQALLEGAGGELRSLSGAPLRYNQQESLYNPYFYAIADPAQALWAHLPSD
jgi:3'(2'), 5'-bisphosphate nucleotidase